jgi:hypothetical protein
MAYMTPLLIEASRDIHDCPGLLAILGLRPTRNGDAVSLPFRAAEPGG